MHASSVQAPVDMLIIFTHNSVCWPRPVAEPVPKYCCVWMMDELISCPFVAHDRSNCPRASSAVVANGCLCLAPRSPVPLQLPIFDDLRSVQMGPFPTGITSADAALYLKGLEIHLSLPRGVPLASSVIFPAHSL